MMVEHQEHHASPRRPSLTTTYSFVCVCVCVCVCVWAMAMQHFFDGSLDEKAPVRGGASHACCMRVACVLYASDPYTHERAGANNVRKPNHVVIKL